MTDVNYYEVLGLQRGVTTSEIKARYRALAKKYHPDVNGNAEKMSHINEAYKVLSDPGSRFKYDQKLKSAQIQRKVSPPEPTVVVHPRRYNAYSKGSTVSNGRRFSLWKLVVAGGALATVALIVLVASLGGQKTQQLDATNVSSSQPNNSSYTVPNDNAATSKQVAAAEAKLKQEEAQAIQSQTLANQYSLQAQQDYQNAQDIGQQSQASYNAAEQEIQQGQINSTQLQQQSQQLAQQIQQEQQSIAMSGSSASVCISNIPGASQLGTLSQKIANLSEQIGNLNNAVQSEGSYSGATASQIGNNYNSQYLVLEQELGTDQSTYNTIESQVSNCIE